MIKGDHPKKRKELLNEREQVCMRMKVILILSAITSKVV